MILPANATIGGHSAGLQWFTSDGLSGNKFPAGIWPETFAVGCRQLVQPPHHGVDAAILCILQRAAAKWRKTGCKHRACVQQVRVLDYSRAKARHSLVEQGQYQPILEVFGQGGISHVMLLRLAVLPAVKTLAALAAELFLLDQFDEDSRDFP